MTTLLGNAVVRVRLDTSGLNPSRLGSDLGNRIGSAMKAGMIAAAAGAAAGIAATMKTAIDGVISQQQNSVTYQTVLKVDKSAADKLIKDLNLLDQKLPASGKTLNAIGAALAGAGVEGTKGVYDLVSAIGTLGGASGATEEAMGRVGTSLSQILSSGKVDWENWKEIKEAGPGIASLVEEGLKKSLGTSDIKGAIEKGLISGEMLQDAFLKASSSPEVAAGMAQSEQMISTRWSAAMGSFQSKVTKVLMDNVGSVNAVIDLIGAGLARSADTFSILVTAAAKGIAWIQKVADIVRVWAEENETLVSSLKTFVTVFGGVLGAIFAVSKALAYAKAAFAILGAAVAANPVVLAVAAIVAGLVVLYRESDTFRGYVDRLKDSFLGLFKEGSGFRDSLSDIAERAKQLGLTIRDYLVAGFNRVKEGYEAIRPGLMAFVGQITTLGQAVWDILKTIGSGVASFVTGTVWPAILAIKDFVLGEVVPLLMTMSRNLLPVFAFIGTAIAGLWNGVVYPVLRTLLAFIQGVLLPVIGFLWNNVLKPTLEALGTLLRDVVWPIAKAVFEGISVLIGALGVALTWVWTTIIQPVLDGFSWLLLNVLTPAFLSIKDVALTAWAFISDAIAAAWGFISPILASLWSWIQNTLIPVFQAYWLMVQFVWDSVKAKISDVWYTYVLPVLTALWAYIQNTLVPIFWALWDGVRSVWDNVSEKISTVVDFIGGTFNRLKAGLEDLKGSFSRILDGIGVLWDGLKDKASNPVRFVINDVFVGKLKPMWDNIRKLVPALPDWSPQKYEALKGFDTGGWTGPGDRLQPAGIVHADEHVIRKSSRRSIEAARPGYLDALNRWGAGAIGYADGGKVEIPGYAGGGLAKPWPTYVAAVLRKLFPGIKSIGGYGARANASDHPSGNALDVMVTPRSELGDRISAWSMANFGPLMLKYVIWSQRINKGGGWKGMADRGSVTANHYDHPHLSFIHDKWGRPEALGNVLSPDEVAGLIGSGAVANPVAGLVRGVLDTAMAPARKLIDGLSAQFGGGMLNDAIAGIANHPLSAIEKFVMDKADALGGITGNPTVGAGDLTENLTGVKAIVNEVASKYGWGSGAQWAAIDWIAQHESSWNPKAKNPKSTAYGLFQFLDSTWKSTGHSKSADPRIQAEAGMKYFQNRYGTPAAAKAFWEKNRWYDSGGIGQGVGFMAKNTLRPERVLSPRQTEAFEDWMRGNHTQQAAPVIGGDLVLQGSGNVRDDMDEVTFQLRRLQRGGIT